jgi:hypothetical protein
MYSMMLFPETATVNYIDSLTQKFRNDNNYWDTFYNDSYETLKRNHSQKAAEHFQVVFSNRFDEQKWRNRLASF